MADARVFIGWIPPNDPDVPETDEKALYRARDEGTDLLFMDYYVVSRYLKHGHIYHMPITSPRGFTGESSAFVQLAAPTLLWVADWTASRAKIVPPIPNPSLIRQQGIHTGQGSGRNSETWFLLNEFLEPANAVLGSDGVTPVYRVSGMYVYGCLNPSDLLVDSAVVPLLPHYKPNATDRKIDRNLLINGIIDIGGA